MTLVLLFLISASAGALFLVLASNAADRVLGWRDEKERMEARALALRVQPFKPEPAVLGWYTPEPQKEPRRTLRPSDLKREPVTLSDVRVEVIRLKRRREELAERRRAHDQEQARFMDVFKLTQEDYDFQPGA
jgi:hypothetical protein